MSDDDDRKAADALPAGALVEASRQVSRAIAARDDLAVRAALHALARRGALRDALHVWALAIAELGPARLPGGALAVAPKPARLELKGEPAWHVEFRTAMRAARDRDGVSLHASIERVFAEPSRINLANYAGSFGASAVRVFDEVSARPGTVRLLHHIGHAGKTGDHWSVAGPAYRLTSAILAVIDMDGVGAHSITPELRTIADMDSEDLFTALQLLVAVAVTLAAGGPGDDLSGSVPHPAGLTDPSKVPEQVEGARLSGVLMTVMRDRARDFVAAAYDLTPSQQVLAAYGAANSLACRVHRLWGP